MEGKEEEEEFKTIPIWTKRKTVLVYAKCSVIDYEELNKYTWSLNSDGYAQTSINNNMIRMHNYVKLILEGLTLPENYIIDHNGKGKNNDRLDNRRSMLRFITLKQNAQNKGKRKDASTDFLGVSIRENGKFIASITIDYNDIYIGIFDDAETAAIAYDSYLLNRPDYNNLMYNLNFPDNAETNKNFKHQKRQRQGKYKGVTKHGNGYMAKISIDDVSYTHCSRSEIECAEFYDDQIVKYGLDRPLNILERYPDYIPERPIKTKKEDIDGTTFVKLILPSYPTISVIIDAQNYEIVKYYAVSYNRKYVFISIDKKSLRIHRYFMNETNPKILIDHIDGNPCNNTLTNLMRATSKENSENKKSKRKYQGVEGPTKSKSYRARVKDKFYRYTKSHKSEEHAARDRDLEIMIHLPKSRYRLNFEWNEDDKQKWIKILKKEIKK